MGCKQSSASVAVTQSGTNQLEDIVRMPSAKLVVRMPTDPCHLADVQEVFPYQGEILHTEHRAITLVQLRHVLEFVANRCSAWVDISPPHVSTTSGQIISIEWANLYHVNTWLIRPATEKDNCAFVELFTNQPQIPNWFISHWWGEAHWEFFACVLKHCITRRVGEMQASMDSITYWICAYANRQHNLGQELTLDPKETSFYKALELSIGVLLILDGPKKDTGPATPFERIWCDFEQSMAVDPRWELDIAIFRHFQPSDENLPDPLGHRKCRSADCPYLQHPEQDNGYCCRMCRAGVGHGEHCVQEYCSRPVQDEAFLLHFVRQPNLCMLWSKGQAELLTHRSLPIDGQCYPALKKARRERTFPMDIIAFGLSVQIQKGQASVPADRTHILNSIAKQPLHMNALEEHEEYEKVNQKLHAKFALAALGNAARMGKLNEIPIVENISRDQSLTQIDLNITGCALVTDVEKVSSAFTGLQNLKVLKLHLGRCERLANIEALGKGLSTVPLVQHLEIDFSYDDLLQDVSPVGVGIAQMPQLRWLVLSLRNCSGLQTLEQFFASLAFCTTVQHLKLNCRKCDQLVSIAGLGMAMQACSELRDVNLIFAKCSGLVGISAELEVGLSGNVQLEDLQLDIHQIAFLTTACNFEPVGRACLSSPNLKRFSAVLAESCIEGVDKFANYLVQLREVRLDVQCVEQAHESLRREWEWEDKDLLILALAELRGSLHKLEHLKVSKIFLVRRDSANRCILEHAAEFNKSAQALPMILASHPGLALVEGPTIRVAPPWIGCSSDISQLSIGSAREALLAHLDGELLRVSSKLEDNKRVLQVEHRRVAPNVFTQVNVWPVGSAQNPPPYFHVARSFEVNDDGTVSLVSDRSLVLGAYCPCIPGIESTSI